MRETAMHITNRSVEALQYTKSDNAAQYHFDDTFSGFGVRVYPSGRKSFVLAYRNKTGSKRHLILGSYPEMKVHKARELAETHYYEIKQGNDPHASKKTNRDEITFEELAGRYLEYAKPHKKSWHDDQQRLRKHILPTLGKRKLSEITLMQLQKLQRSLLSTVSPATCNRCFALIKHMFTMALKWNLLNESPARHVEMLREPPPRDIVLTPDECLRILESCDQEPNIYAAALFKLCMFTGRRVGEWLHAKWDDLDKNSGRLRVPDTKANERQFAYLNDNALEVLHSLPRVADNPHIIVGREPGKPLHTYRKAWQRVLTDAGITFFPIHGLRHNFASTLVAANIPLEEVGHLLGHKSSLTTRKYTHHRPDRLRTAANSFGQEMSKKVVSIEEARANRSKGTASHVTS